MKTFTEPLEPGKEFSDLIEKVSASIAPDDVFLISWYESYSSSQKNRLASDLAIINNYVPKNAKLLEIGSIPLILSGALARLGYTDFQGMDIDPSRFTSAIKQNSLKVHKCDIESESFPLESNSFDAVIFNELFEHLRINPLFTFREVNRILRTDGILLLSTPNLRSLKRTINFLLFNHTGPNLKNPPGIYDEYIKLEQIHHMGHVRVYTTNEAIQFLEKMGFSVEAIIYRGSFPESLARIVTRCLPSLKPFFTLIARKI